MTKGGTKAPADAAGLRERAEKIVSQKSAARNGGVEESSPEGMRRALHELRVYQVELEMQNEELRRAHAELDVAQARYVALFDFAPVGYLTLSEQGIVVDANLTLATLLGMDRKALVQQPITRFIVEEDRDIYHRHHHALIETGAPQTCELRMIKQDGSVCWTRLAATGEGFAEGGIACRVVIEDVTARNHQERRLEAARTSLVQADRLATVGLLTAGVAHEINNPLSYVLFNLESLVEDFSRREELVGKTQRRRSARSRASETPQARSVASFELGAEGLQDVIDRVREALDGAQRIREIVGGLGTFSRVELAAVTAVDVRTTLEHAIVMATNEIKFRARLVKDLGEVPAVLGSEGKIAQVFLNLLINAAHAIDEGHVEQNEIRVRTWAEGELVCVEVSDTGSGIPPEHREKIFEPFFTTKRLGVGSGLGLSSVKTIVADCGGQLGVTSEVGQGARFVVKLPRVPCDWKPPEIALNEPSAPHQKARGRILVVDDEAGIRASIVRALRGEHEVIAESTGEGARQLLEQDRGFDLILCDLMMPELSGMELHAWLAGRYPELARRVVFITGGAFTPKAAEYMAAVENECVEKSFGNQMIRGIAERFVAAARAKTDE